MDAPQVFCLSSKQFESRMRSNLTDLRVGKDFCDVTIGCEDQEIEAHKVVLAGGSLLFNNLLKQNPHHHPFIFLRGINFSFLSKILDFLYQGEVHIDKNELDDFLSVAKDLKINGLTEDSKQSKYFVEEGAKDKRPRLINRPEHQHTDFNPENNDICTEMDDFGPELITESYVNSDDNTEDDVEKVILPNHQLAETPLTIPSGDQKVKGKLRIRDIAKLTENPFQTKSCSMEQETPKNYFSCEQCNKNYGNKYFLKSHIDSVHNGVSYSCEECNFKTKWKPSLKIHIDSSHNEKSTEQGIPKSHLLAIHNGNNSAHDLKSNALTVGNSNQSPEGSKKKSQQLLGIGRNLCFEFKMDNFGSEPITQSFVDFGDNNEDGVIEKVSKKHLRVDIIKLRMKDIEKLTKNSSQIQSSSIEKDISENDFTCKQCNKSYYNKYYLKCHVDSVHNGNDFKCEQCNKSYSSKGSLKKHINYIHNAHNGVSSSCEKCYYTTTDLGKLRNHVLSTHNGNRSGYEGVMYSCELCDHKATKKVHLERHIKSYHKAGHDL